MPRKHLWHIFINNKGLEYSLNRRQRLKIIEGIIGQKKISSQDELVRELKKMGHEVAQSTISRDIHELRLIKVRDHTQQEFYSSEGRFYRENIFDMDKFSSKFASSVLSISRAENILVIRTYPGEAQGTAAIIDGMNFVEILGTVAGDDTIICIAKDTPAARKIKGLMDKQ
jgi:transcriptional regulator of arginine metabolism